MKTLFLKGGNAISKIDWWFIGPLFFLVILGLVMQYSIGINQEVSTLSSFYKQLTIVLIGITIFVVINTIDHRVIKTHPFIYAVLAVIILLSVLIFGTNIKGTTGWFIIAGFSFQPVELVKILFIMFMATYFEKDPALVKEPRYLLTSGVVAAVLLALIIAQPDLGSAFIIFVIWFVYVVFLKAPKWFIAAVIVMSVSLFATGWFFVFEDYQRSRLTTFIQPESDPLGEGYNITQSMVAIGSGSLWGRGLGLGTQSQLHFLPEVTSDFIFAAIAEELGFIGVFGIITALGILLFRLWLYMRRTADHYTFLFLFGVFIYIGTQSVLVIGMNLGLLPITGVPLPLISAGGSSMLITLFLLGAAHHLGAESD